MTLALRAALGCLLLALLAPAAASAHVGAPTAAAEGYQWANVNAPAFTPAMKNLEQPRFEKGSCTDEAARSVPVDEAHDHLDVTQHRFKCRLEQVAFNSLKEVFTARPDVTLGEMDVKGNLAAVAIAYPESGFLLFDISNPAAPEFLSWYRGQECEGLAIDVDCGAFVDISPDLERVYISVQQITLAPFPTIQSRPAQAFPGIEVVDISDRKRPASVQPLPVNSVGGVHTTRSFEVPEGTSSEEEPREPGEWTFSIANGVGIEIHKVTEAGLLDPESTVIDLAEAHDTFIQNDELTGRTFMYIAAGFDTGFYVYDVTAPSQPKLLAEWDLTPECRQDWYSHTIDVATRNGRRYVTMPVELIDFFGDQSEEDQGEGCGKLAGNGDMSGPLWIVDATDLGKLGPADANGNASSTATGSASSNAARKERNRQLKAASEPALTATWSNAANRAGGALTFSPHNQQIVGDRIFLSGYHSGVTVLDASAAFRGENVRPKEIGIHVPSAPETRPIHPKRGGNVPATGLSPDDTRLVENSFFTSVINFRPLIWDMQYVNGVVLAADMTGGFYALRADDDDPDKTDANKPAAAPATTPTGLPPKQNAAPTPAPAAKPTGCTDRDRPATRFTRARLTRRGIALRGRSTDAGCSGLRRVQVAVGRTIGRKRCRFVRANGKLSPARRCSRPIYLNAKGTGTWSFAKKVRLARRSHLVFARATDKAGNRERFSLRVNGKRVRVR